MSVNFVIGDIHGYYDALVSLLRDDAGLIDYRGRWCGRDATLCLIGDYFDRGPDGIAVIDLLIRLQAQAILAGGRVVPLLGNHDVLMLATSKFQHYVPRGYHPTETLLNIWLLSGGVDSDLRRLNSAHLIWLSRLAAMMRIDDVLLIHADSMFYCDYGASVWEVNDAIRGVLAGDDPTLMDTLMQKFVQRYDFHPVNRQGDMNPDAADNVQTMLRIFGGQRIIHGHTPVWRMSQEDPKDVTAPYVYAEGRCINVDHCLYKGGQGFVYMF